MTESFLDGINIIANDSIPEDKMLLVTHCIEHETLYLDPRVDPELVIGLGRCSSGCIEHPIRDAVLIKGFNRE